MRDLGHGAHARSAPVRAGVETELSMIQDRYASEWSPADEVSFLDAQLSLYSYTLVQRKINHPSKIFIQQDIPLFRSASYAVFFLLRILGTAPRKCIDETGVRNIVRQIFTLMREMSQIANTRRSQCLRVYRIIGHMIDGKDWNQGTPVLGKAEPFMANNFVADVAARGIIKGNTRHAAAKTERETVVARVPPGGESTFDLNFSLSIWDPMEWNVN
ncbi:hypothetical protein BDW68DRAFT_182193 [Aspergillus falconensis]